MQDPNEEKLRDLARCLKVLHELPLPVLVLLSFEVELHRPVRVR